jgi:hypothetical protein
MNARPLGGRIHPRLFFSMTRTPTNFSRIFVTTQPSSGIWGSAGNPRFFFFG